MNEFVWNVSGMILTGKNLSTLGKNPFPLSLSSPKISHALRLRLKPGLRVKPWRGQDVAACVEDYETGFSVGASFCMGKVPLRWEGKAFVCVRWPATHRHERTTRGGTPDLELARRIILKGKVYCGWAGIAQSV
jgi:hypothetical protein